MGMEEQLNSFNELEDCHKGFQRLYGIVALNRKFNTKNYTKPIGGNYEAHIFIVHK